MFPWVGLAGVAATCKAFVVTGVVLVLASDPAFRGLLSVVLTDAGYDVHAAGSLGEALAFEPRPAIIVADSDTPEVRVGGLFAELAGWPPPRPPVLLLAGTDDSLSELPHQKHLAIARLVKPFRMSDLLGTARALLDTVPS